MSVREMFELRVYVCKYVLVHVICIFIVSYNFIIE